MISRLSTAAAVFAVVATAVFSFAVEARAARPAAVAGIEAAAAPLPLVVLPMVMVIGKKVR